MKQTKQKRLLTKVISILAAAGLAVGLVACEIPGEIDPEPADDPTPMAPEEVPRGHDRDALTTDQAPPLRANVPAREYVEYIEELDAQQLNNDAAVVDAMDNLQQALSALVQQNYLEKMEEQPGLGQPEDRPGVDTEAEVAEAPRDQMERHQRALEASVRGMSANVGQEAFSQHFYEGAQAAAQLTAVLQETFHPEFDIQRRNLERAAEDIAADATVEEQQEEIHNFFEASAEVIDAMEQRLFEQLRM